MNMKRMRGRNHRPNSGGGGGGFRNQQNGIPLNRNHVFDSTGPEMRVRGTAQQLYDKYQQMARDAFSNGDRVTGEAYYQHAEHYFRIISAINQAQGQPNGPQNGQPYQNNGQDRSNYQNNGQDRGDYNRRDQNTGDVSTEPQPETRNEPRNDQRNEPRSEQRFQDRPQENRYQERPRFEPRQNDQRNNDQRNNNEHRNNEHRNNDQRPNKQEFQRQDRQDRYRPVQEAPAIDPRIDISSALEAELAATVAEPAQTEFAGFGDQPAVETRNESPQIEARSIPIIPDAPPAAEPARRPRGRPRAVKPETEKVATEE
jgi:hypothetical protein